MCHLPCRSHLHRWRDPSLSIASVLVRAFAARSATRRKTAVVELEAVEGSEIKPYSTIAAHGLAS
jgi:hypothetical protein